MAHESGEVEMATTYRDRLGETRPRRLTTVLFVTEVTVIRKVLARNGRHLDLAVRRDIPSGHRWTRSMKWRVCGEVDRPIGQSVGQSVADGGPALLARYSHTVYVHVEKSQRKRN